MEIYHEYDSLFDGVEFDAPEGRLTARVKTSVVADGRVELLLWFYNKAGEPEDLNLTVNAPAFSADDLNLRREFVEKVQGWLSGIRDGEPVLRVA